MEPIFDSKHEIVSVRIPRLLFRYCNANENLLSTLKDSYLWFSAPDALNDPLECRDIFDRNNTFKELKRFWKRHVEHNPYLDFKPQEAKVGAQIILNNKEIADKMWTEIYRRAIAPVNLCCFSASANANLLWSHYADGHRGIVLLFDTPTLVHNQFAIVKVKYQRSPPRYNYIRELLTFGDGTSEYFWRFDQIVCGTKTIEWAYEEEIRLISHKSGKNSFAPRALVGVIFGHKMDEEMRAKINAILAETYANVWVTAEELDEKTGQIVIPGLQEREPGMFEMAVSGWRRLS
jgi:hypothetical protein